LLKKANSRGAIVLWLDDFFAEPMRRVSQEQREFLASPESKKPDWHLMAALLATAAILALQYYLFHGGRLLDLLDLLALVLPGGSDAPLLRWLNSRENARLTMLAWWAVGLSITYVLVPIVIVCGIFRRPLSDYGVKVRGSLNCWWVYLLMYLAIVPFVLRASTTESFLRTYPFYKLDAGEPLWPRFFVWELLYAMQFVSLEFFFRGFLLHSMRRRFGVYAIFAMMIPYCMIHFGKPIPETYGAIFAGVILGFMSLKTRSIWLGAATHIAVAWTMDAAAIWQRFH